MNKYLNDLLIIDQEIGDFFYQNNDLSDNELDIKFEEKDFIGKALKIIDKLSNKDVLELLKRCSYLNDYIDIKKFIKKYPLNKSYLKKNKELYLDEYHKLRNTCIYLCDISSNYQEFQEYMDVIDADGVEAYLLSNMPNKQIYSLSLETTDWSQKLYYFSYFKLNEKN